MRNVFKKKSASSQARLVRKGMSWNHADQLLPVEAEEEELERELDEIPVGIATTPRAIAIALMLAMAVVVEFTLLRSNGFAGLAAFFPIAALLICIGIPGRSFGPYTLVVAAMLCIVSLRLTMNGTWVHLVIAGWLLTALTLCFRHQKPFLLQTLMFGVESLYLGYEFFLSFKTKLSVAFVPPDEERSSALFNYGMPAGVVALVGIAALAMQPELVTQMLASFDAQKTNVQAATTTLLETNVVHVGAWLLTVWVTAGFLRPILSQSPEVASDITPMEDGVYHAPLFVPLRNTLVTAMALFGIFLVSGANGTESHSLQHSLQSLKLFTISALISTALLAVIFTGPNLADNRIDGMRKLSCGLLGLNLLFATIVAYRLSQSVQWSEMSRLDIQLLLTLSGLVVLLGLAAYLIFVQHSAAWLLRRAGWILAVAGFLYCVLPLDRLVENRSGQLVVKANKPQIAASHDDESAASTD